MESRYHKHYSADNMDMNNENQKENIEHPTRHWDHPVSPHEVSRAIKLSYIQSMLVMVYVGCTSGGFATGYALMLGANDVQIGMLTSIPMLAVLAQPIAAMLIERGISRRNLTFIISLVQMSTWIPVIMVPFVMGGKSSSAKIAALITIFTIREIMSHTATNVRAGWIGDLIPQRTLGTFFGRIELYSGVVGTLVGILAGKILDIVKSAGAKGFGWVFSIGILFGLAYAALFIPQADVPVKKHEHGRISVMVRETFANRRLVAVMIYATLVSLPIMAAPFYPTYLLRDVKISYLGLNIVTGVSTLTMIISSPIWGRVIERYGCRPVIIACTATIAPLPIVWIWATNPQMVYALVIPANLLGGIAGGGLFIAINTLIYKITPEQGRAMQLAIYSIVVTMIVAPLPIIGGYIPRLVKGDLRVIFWITIIFYGVAAYAATKISEEDARPTREMIAAFANKATRIISRTRYE